MNVSMLLSTSKFYPLILIRKIQSTFYLRPFPHWTIRQMPMLGIDANDISTTPSCFIFACVKACFSNLCVLPHSLQRTLESLRPINTPCLFSKWLVIWCIALNWLRQMKHLDLPVCGSFGIQGRMTWGKLVRRRMDASPCTAL